jgi:hypothetical protein
MERMVVDLVPISTGTGEDMLTNINITFPTQLFELMLQLRVTASDIKCHRIYLLKIRIVQGIFPVRVYFK